MVCATFSSFCRSPNLDQRLGMALLVSALLHALMLLTLSNYSIHGSAFTRPVHPPIERLDREITRVAWRDAYGDQPEECFAS